jgi:predicted DNA-binding transcriptional regulator YafY
MARDVRLSFNYTRADGDSAPRTVDPLGIVCKQSVWYLVANAPAGLRTYRVSRIADAVALSTTFKRPKNFDLAKYWAASTATLKQRPFSTTLALSPKAVAVIVPFTPAIPAKSSTRLPAGWQAFKINFETESQAKFVTLGLGSGARAIAPPSLLEHIRSEHAALLVR